MHPIIIDVNGQKIQLDLWDKAGNEKFGGLRNEFYLGAEDGRSYSF